MVDPDIGLMEIRTSADADTDHELVVPHELADRFVVRIAGETVWDRQDLPFVPTSRRPDSTVAMGQTVTIELGATGRAR